MQKHMIVLFQDHPLDNRLNQISKVEQIPKYNRHQQPSYALYPAESF